MAVENGTGSAAAPAVDPGAASAPSVQPKGPWDGLSPEDLALVQDRHWEGPSDLIRSYRHAENRLGASPDKLLRIPAAEDAEGWNKLYGQLGRPESPDKYDLGEHAPGEGQIDLRPLAHQIGLTNEQMLRAAPLFKEMIEAQSAAAEEARAAQSEADLAALQKEWGNEYAPNVQAAKRAKQALGWDDATLDKLEQALGTAETMKLAARIGRGLVGDAFAGDATDPQTGASRPFGMTREAAAREYKRMDADPQFKARLWSADPAVAKKAREERDQVARIAYDD